MTLAGLVVAQPFSRPARELEALCASIRSALAGTDSLAQRTQFRGARLTVALGRLSIALGDTLGARSARDALMRLSDSAQAHEIEALAAARAGRDREALALLDSAQKPTWFGLAVADAYLGQAVERFIRADWLAAGGQPEEALRWYQTLGQFGPDDLPFVAPAELRQGEILEHLGRLPDAARHYSRALELWRDPDPEFMPLVTNARHRLLAIKATTARTR